MRKLKEFKKGITNTHACAWEKQIYLKNTFDLLIICID